MAESLVSSTFLWAQAQGGAGGAFAQFLPIIVACFAIYLMLIRPQRREEKKRRLRVDGLVKGDKVMTGSGIYGTVVSVDHEAKKVVVRVDDNCRLTFAKAAITEVLDDANKTKDSTKDKPAGVAGLE